jgi:hypothetical protein
MLIVYDPYDDFAGYNQQPQVPLTHLASELVEAYGYHGQELNAAMEHAFNVCLALHIPIEFHFRRVYLAGNHQLATDWMLSDLGSYLLLMSGNSHNPNVARARLYACTRH